MAKEDTWESRENTFLFSFFFCCHTSLVSSPYSFSNSSTNSFAFSRFSLLSHVSSSAIYLFYCTKNFSFSFTILLFSIFSTLNSSFSLIITGFSGTLFYLSTCGLYRCIQLTLTTGYILIELDNSNSTALLEIIPFIL